MQVFAQDEDGVHYNARCEEAIPSVDPDRNVFYDFPHILVLLHESLKSA